MLIAPLLLINNVIGFFWKSDVLLKKNDSHMACWTAWEIAIYLASVIDVTIVSCLFVDYDTSSLPM